MTGSTNGLRPWRSAALAWSRERLQWNRNPARDGFLLGAAIYVLGIAAGYIPYGTDARIWWATRPPDLYPFDTYIAGQPGYFYSPAFAQVIQPFTVLSERVFVSLWTALLLGVLYALVGRWSIAALLFPPVALDVYAGNIHLLLAAVTVFGLRWPGVWAFALLTKVAPGIGLVWFVVRREWRNLFIALGATASIVLVSFLILPGAWLDWMRLLAGNLGTADVTYPHLPVPMLIRFPLAVAIVGWGGMTDRRWAVPLGAMLALPVIWPGSLAMLVSVYALRDGDHRE